MKMEYVDGCVCTSLTIDGVESVDMSENDFRQVVRKMIPYIDERKLLVCLMEYIEDVEAIDDYETYEEKVYTENDEVLKGKIDSYIIRCDDFAVLQGIWMKVMECMGEYEDLGHCECCGDYITKYTMDIP